MELCKHGSRDLILYKLNAKYLQPFLNFANFHVGQQATFTVDLIIGRTLNMQ